jgi:hypothetical protein
MTADYTAKGDAFTAKKPSPWSNTQNLDVDPTNPYLDRAPDGKRFVVSRLPPPDSAGGPKGSLHVTFLLNFFDELQRRVPLGK